MNYLGIKINNAQKEYKLDLENNLKDYYYDKMKAKKKEWEDQIERAKWRTPVQAHGEMKCKNGHHLNDDPVVYGKWEKGFLYWVDSDEKYVICKNCNKVKKISGHLI